MFGGKARIDQERSGIKLIKMLTQIGYDKRLE